MTEEDFEILDEDTLKDSLAQYKYENKRLRDEVDNLRRNSFSFEENLNSLCDDLKKKDSSLQRSDRQIMSLLQTINEKDLLLDVLEKKIGQTLETNKQLEADLALLKDEKNKLVEEQELHIVREKEFTEKHSQIEKERAESRRIVNSLEEENASNVALLNDLYRQIKFLEDEKIALQDRLDVLLNEKCDKQTPLHLSPSSTYNSQSVNSSPVQRCLDFSNQGNQSTYAFDNDLNQLNLREELLLAEIHEKQLRINELDEIVIKCEHNLQTKVSVVRERLEAAVDVISLCWNNSKVDFQFINSSNFQKLIHEIRNWLEGESGESNPLTDTPDAVKVKESVINSQPVTTRTVESISIATQTDRILLAKALEEFSPIQNVLDHKYNDVDMDLYRSYRKLSILPEEEDDETLKRIPSLKSAVNSNSFSAKLPQSYKTHSADDILIFDKRITKGPPSEKLISSCTNIILSNGENGLDNSVCDSQKPGKKSGSDFPIICDSKLSDNSNIKSEQRSINNSNETNLATLDPLEVLRQPHSFDSYLDPQQIQVTSLARQISDPTQNTAFDLPLTRRGSYLRRPRSTCRPLRLPCEENGMKREDRVSKVRFDLSNNGNSKLCDNTNGSKGPMLASNLKNHSKIERISRFTVERVDEDEFRKSIDESSKMANRKRPPLIHSVVYKKSVLHDMTIYDPEGSVGSSEGTVSRVNVTGSPDSPSNETATESSPVDSFDMASYESNYLMADIYPCKRRKQSDSSSYSIESQDSIDGNDILVKSIRLHTNSEYITMKELDRESSTSSHLSMDMDIPYIDAEELPVIKPSPDVIKISSSFANDDDSTLNAAQDFEEEKCVDLMKSSSPKIESPINQSDSSETFVTACSDITPTSEVPEALLSPPKSSGLSKSPTVLKNLSNFELYSTLSESMSHNKRGSASVRNQIVEEEEEASDVTEGSEGAVKPEDDHDEEEEESTILKLTSSDASEISDTVTYVTVKSDPSNFLLSSDGDSDTYVTIQSDKSTLERKFSDLSENSSSPYNTPPDTSSASFCTPPDTYSPILSRLAKHFGASFEGDSPRNQTRSSSPHRNVDRSSPPVSDRTEQHPIPSVNITLNYDTPPNVSPFSSPTGSSPYKRNKHLNHESLPDNESVTIYNLDDSNFPSESANSAGRKELIMFDSPKLEFYETNDSIENLEAFLKTEEGLQELVKTPIVNDRSSWTCNLEDLQEEPTTGEESERKNSDAEEVTFKEGLSKTNSLESPSGVGDTKFFEKRNKRHPPLSRQNSTEEYNFLEPHDSCLNLSEEISSPSTTPDTSNKTVIFKNKPLTVSNTIDLEDDDFPISESEIQINFNGSETEIVEIPIGHRTVTNKRMSSKNNTAREDQEEGLSKSRKDCVSPHSPTENSKEEHHTIHGNALPNYSENDSALNHMHEEQDNFMAVQSDLEVESCNVEQLNEDIYNVDAGIDIEGKTTLSEEEINKKFQELGLAFRTDVMTLQKRLIIRKRLRDQAELIVEKEINMMKSKLNNLRYLCSDSDSLQQLSDLNKHLDIILASSNYLSGSAESYGFVQNEEKMSRAVSVILKQIESIERIQSELCKSPDIDKVDGKRIQLLPILDDERHEEKFLRRRSVAALAMNGTAKRRASIASVPRNSLPSDDSNGSQYSSTPSIAVSRSPGTNNKLSHNQSNTIKPISPLAVGDQMRIRSRKESKGGEDRFGMKYIQDYGTSHSATDDNDDLLLSSDEEISVVDKNTSQLTAHRISSSFDNRMRTNSVASETLNVIDSLRNVVKWNIILIRNSRFQFPENVRQYVPFLITWYVIILMVAIFASGFFTGFHRCFDSRLFYSYSCISGIITLWITVVNFLVKCKPLKLPFVAALVMYVSSLLYTLHDEGLDAAFMRLGIRFETHYPYGAPPV